MYNNNNNHHHRDTLKICHFVQNLTIQIVLTCERVADRESGSFRSHVDLFHSGAV